MSNSTTQILVQNIELFETIATFPNMEAFDAWMDSTTSFGIVSLDQDVDGEYAWVALVAAATAPDFMMDMTSGEMEPVIAPVAFTPPTSMVDDATTITSDDVPDVAPRAAKKGGKQYQILASFISANPGVSRTTVFSNQGLLHALRTTSQVSLINSSDKVETKRWNRRLNFLIRDMRRGGVEVTIERKGRVAHYSIANSGQLQLPFDDAAKATNSAIIGNDVINDVIDAPVPPKQDAMRLIEQPNQNLSFESLLSQLDEDEATVLSDDQIAFKAAREMIK